MLDTMDNTSASSFSLTKQDRCDAKCPAQAFVLVKFLTGELLFCGHHFDRYEAAIIKDSYEVIDERNRIDDKTETPQ